MYYLGTEINYLSDSDLEKALKGKPVIIRTTTGRRIGPVIVRNFCVTSCATIDYTISHLVLSSGEEIPRAIIYELETLLDDNVSLV